MQVAGSVLNRKLACWAKHDDAMLVFDALILARIFLIL